ncbi:MAG: heme-binding protein [Congregibacter sp.]|nr:heme-binding protein [Congregibacter sp.]
MKALLFVPLSALLLLIHAGMSMAIEEPNYTVIEQSGDFELRAYEPMIVAETFIDGDMDTASNQGFRKIAGYIFGKNSVQSGESEKVAMTAPVTMQAVPQKIAMTTPVTSTRDGEQWRVHFVMPSEYTMDTLPVPDNPEVTLREVPGSYFAVLRFSGLVSEKKRADKTDELLRWLKERDVAVVGEPSLARYNPPWTLPFLRRNEVMIEYLPKAPSID